MSEFVLTSVAIYGRDHKSMTELPVKPMGMGERIGRATVQFLILGGIATACVFIPILHFILVPLFLILAPVSALVSFLQADKVSACNLQCPSCDKTVTIKTKAIRWPFRETCPNCGERLRFERKSSDEI
ncbi:MAG: hypothetical protein KDD22_02300 [Bdellovibrionales bacterium]|nr:hypothetical protein [Bdellovibrionales bacterium]